MNIEDDIKEIKQDIITILHHICKIESTLQNKNDFKAINCVICGRIIEPNMPQTETKFGVIHQDCNKPNYLRKEG